MNTYLAKSKSKTHDLNLKNFQIKQKTKLCIVVIFIVQIIVKLAGLAWNPILNPQSEVPYFISLAFPLLIPLVIAIEYLLFKKKGPEVVKYSGLVEIILLVFFTGDWIMMIASNMLTMSPTNPPCFNAITVYAFSSFAWRTLMVALIIQKWQLKIIPPVIALFISTAFVIYYTRENLVFMLIRASVQLFSVGLIVYCEDKVKWKIMWMNLQQEKWVQVNNFILNSLPENIMIIDLKGETKFISDYCKSFMKKFHLASDPKYLFDKIHDLHQQRDEQPNQNLSIERFATENGLMIGTTGNSSLKFEVLEDLIANFQQRILKKDLQERQFLIYNGKLKTEEGSPDRAIEVKISFVAHFETEFIILILRDMTQRDLLVTLEETNKYKDQLLASVSHELRAPLNGNINLVESAVNSSEIPNIVKESCLIPALRSSKFLLHLVNDILDMSQIKEKKLRLVFQPEDIKKTLKDVAQLVELQAKKKGVELVLELDPKIPKEVCTDHIRLSQIILNLLNNAIKFTKEGTIKLRAIPGDSWIKISVEDSGIGMSQESLQKLFSTYTQIEFEGRQIMNPNGVGLGLNIASNLVDLLAPKSQKGISVISVPNQGSTFSFVIANKEDLEDSDKTSSSIEIAGESPGIIQPAFYSKRQKKNLTTMSMLPLTTGISESEDAVIMNSCSCSCPKALVVDDNPFNTMAFETILNSLEIKSESVYSGSCCIKKLLDSQKNQCGKECKQYSVIFMDQEMPDMSGGETVNEIQRLQKASLIEPNIKIIGCTAHQSKEEMDKFLESGLDQCISKPISKVKIQDIFKELS